MVFIRHCPGESGDGTESWLLFLCKWFFHNCSGSIFPDSGKSGCGRISAGNGIFWRLFVCHIPNLHIRWPSMHSVCPVLSRKMSSGQAGAGKTAAVDVNQGLDAPMV